MSTLEEKQFYTDLGQKLLNLRSEAGIKKTEIAEKLGVNTSILSEAENHGKKLSAYRLTQILDVLGYELSYVKKNPNPSPSN